MNPTFKQVTKTRYVELVAELAQEIFVQHYTKLTPKVAAALADKYQSDILTDDEIHSGVINYFLIYLGTEPVGTLKTAKSARTVVILPQAADRLIEIAASRAAEGREWLSDRGDRLPMNRSICNNRWRKLCAARGIDHIPWSNLRNSWRTIAEVELRLPWDLIEMLMGHALPGVSGRHYIRPTAEQVVRAAFDALGIS